MTRYAESGPVIKGRELSAGYLDQYVRLWVADGMLGEEGRFIGSVSRLVW